MMHIKYKYDSCILCQYGRDHKVNRIHHHHIYYEFSICSGKIVSASMKFDLNIIIVIKPHLVQKFRAYLFALHS